MLLRIAITGPESTGKSLLAEGLAAYYRTAWVPEYAREYLESLSHPYEEEDILRIARGQIHSEECQAVDAKGILFCDTELIVTKIWSEVKYGRCHPWIQEQIKEHRYDLYLLTAVDLPWEPDPLREHPEMREKLFSLYHRELTRLGFPFFVVSGVGEARLRNAVKSIEGYFSRELLPLGTD